MSEQLPYIIIKRLWADESGTYGFLRSGNVQCFTIERPWIGNMPFESCIPAGLYRANRDEFSKGKPPYPDLRFEEVPGRTDIEIHAATMPSQLWGCIAPAEFLKIVDGQIHATSSKLTLSAILESFDTDSVYVYIIDP